MVRGAIEERGEGGRGGGRVGGGMGGGGGGGGWERGVRAVDLGVGELIESVNFGRYTEHLVLSVGPGGLDEGVNVPDGGDVLGHEGAELRVQLNSLGGVPVCVAVRSLL